MNRSRQGGVSTSRKWEQIRDNVMRELRMWGKDKDTLFPRYDDCRRTGVVTLQVFTGNRRIDLTCSSQRSPEQNLVAILGEIRSARLADVRGIWALRQQASQLSTALVQVSAPAKAMGGDVAYAVLRAKPDMSREELRKAYLRRLQEVHPDHGGTAADLAALKAAAIELGVA